MKGLILLHRKHRLFWSDRFSVFFNLMSKHTGFPIHVIKERGKAVVPKGLDVVILYGWDAWPQEFPHIRSKTKFIWLSHDIHHAWRLGPNVRKHIDSAISQCYKVLVPYYDSFQRKYPQHIDKAVFFPHFFAPHARFVSLPFNENPKMKCLLSGQTAEGKYPIRSKVMKGVQLGEWKIRASIDVLAHPRFGRKQFFTRENGGQKERYACTLNEYFCCVTDSSNFRLGLTRYFEIPATGSLLLAEECGDIERAGLVPMKHYVPVTWGNVIERIYEVIENPDEYQEIRKVGMEFVRANHSVNNRVNQLKKILKELR